mmetsp:Transcript_28810/g.73761  ORF Transcript_28810/g.73761 Transcript_28810/m.73761 type:complete len:84 (+) Transcript_28810:1865-2116(+)
MCIGQLEYNNKSGVGRELSDKRGGKEEAKIAGWNATNVCVWNGWMARRVHLCDLLTMPLSFRCEGSGCKKENSQRHTRKACTG